MITRSQPVPDQHLLGVPVHRGSLSNIEFRDGRNGHPVCHNLVGPEAESRGIERYDYFSLVTAVLSVLQVEELVQRKLGGGLLASYGEIILV